ncbi:class I SAM-dependent methyltransferase [Brucepastera parasyntrophica]|uniref:class I SAM-dependent methyltransferase n=1 Tax=Brucepastera parasyntrophica TaxID=2880008 RepID=UPI00210D2383|nr:class I SAM-dependent methyltransferase [Brucepastera parasyntrophica]ULQ59020.1 class I SAM-dependent methyltransferase [Brucepastera parasyntrophica]
MKENKYDDPVFFGQYKQMSRSSGGLAAAGEWHQFRKMLPDFTNKRVLDLGCGFGWHCIYAADHGAASVVGIDISEKMLETAREKTGTRKITYINTAIEDAEFEPDSFDIVLSSLAFHYIPAFENVCARVYSWLEESGVFVFSAEHPVFTAYGSQDWIYGPDGAILHWPVDNYFSEGPRDAVFLGEHITKYHRTLTAYLHTLISNGFIITDFVEAEPSSDMLEADPAMKDELRRPMMILVSAVKGPERQKNKA